MRIVCPSCSAAYDVPDSLVTAGRVVRCARCGGEWSPVEAPAASQEPEAPPLPPDEPAPPAARGAAGRSLGTPDEPAPPAAEDTGPPLAPPPRQSAMNRLAAQSTRREPSMRLLLAWIASIAVLVLAAGAAYAWRAEIVAAWPPSARAYAAFGLHPQTETAR